MKITTVALCAAGAGAVLLAAPPAAADPPTLPQAGQEPADATIQDIKSMGYHVSINWVNGQTDMPLSQCQVNDVNDTDAAHGKGTVYVDVMCPH